MSIQMKFKSQRNLKIINEVRTLESCPGRPRPKEREQSVSHHACFEAYFASSCLHCSQTCDPPCLIALIAFNHHEVMRSTLPFLNFLSYNV